MATAVLFQIGSLGDSLVSLPAIRSLGDLLPDADRYILVFQSAPNSHVKPGEVFDLAFHCSRKLQYSLYANRFLTALSAAKLAVTLRLIRPKYAVYLMPSDRTAAQVERDRKFFTLAGVPHLAGFQVASCDNSLPTLDVRRTEAFLRFSRLWQADTLNHFLANAETPLLKLRPEDTNFADQWLRTNRRFLNRPLVAIAPFSNWSSKDLSIAMVRAVADALQNQMDAEVILVGGAKDRIKAEAIGCGLNACGAFSVAQSAAILSRCAALFGADSGPMHLAGALGIPTVAAFSRIASDVSRWLPLGANHTVLYGDVPCAGCGLKTCPLPGHDCIAQISVEAALASLAGQLRADPPLPFSHIAHSWSIPSGVLV